MVTNSHHHRASGEPRLAATLENGQVQLRAFPKNRDSRRKEALFNSAFRIPRSEFDLSLLTSAATGWLECCTIETSTALPNWNSADLTVTVTNQSGAVTFPAPGATNDAQRFYRAVWQ